MTSRDALSRLPDGLVSKSSDRQGMLKVPRCLSDSDAACPLRCSLTATRQGLKPRPSPVRCGRSLRKAQAVATLGFESQKLTRRPTHPTRMAPSIDAPIALLHSQTPYEHHHRPPDTHHHLTQKPLARPPLHLCRLHIRHHQISTSSTHPLDPG